MSALSTGLNLGMSLAKGTGKLGMGATKLAGVGAWKGITGTAKVGAHVLRKGSTSLNNIDKSVSSFGSAALSHFIGDRSREDSRGSGRAVVSSAPGSAVDSRGIISAIEGLSKIMAGIAKSVSTSVVSLDIMKGRIVAIDGNIEYMTELMAEQGETLNNVSRNLVGKEDKKGSGLLSMLAIGAAALLTVFTKLKSSITGIIGKIAGWVLPSASMILSKMFGGGSKSKVPDIDINKGKSVSSPDVDKDGKPTSISKAPGKSEEPSNKKSPNVSKAESPSDAKKKKGLIAKITGLLNKAGKKPGVAAKAMQLISKFAARAAAKAGTALVVGATGAGIVVSAALAALTVWELGELIVELAALIEIDTEALSAAADAVGEAAKEGLQSAGAAVSGAAAGAWSGLKSGVSWMGDQASSAMDTVKEKASGAVEGAKNLASGAAKTAGSAVDTVKEKANVAVGAVATGATAMVEKGKNALSSVAEDIKKSGVFEGFKEGFANFGTAISDGIRRLVDTVAEIPDYLREMFEDFSESLKEMMEELTEKGATMAKSAGRAVSGTYKNLTVDSATKSRNVQFAQTLQKTDPYMYKLAMKESSGGQNLYSTTSSAAGMFQFTEGTWNDIKKKMGNDHWTLEDRLDPEKAYAAAKFLDRQNRQHLKGKLGRDVNDQDAYMAHFMGAGGATKFLKGMQQDPSQRSGNLASEAAVAANSSIFGEGGEKSAQQVYDRLTSGFSSAPTTTAPVLPAASMVAASSENKTPLEINSEKSEKAKAAAAAPTIVMAPPAAPAQAAPSAGGGSSSVVNNYSAPEGDPLWRTITASVAMSRYGTPYGVA